MNNISDLDDLNREFVLEGICCFCMCELQREYRDIGWGRVIEVLKCKDCGEEFVGD